MRPNILIRESIYFFIRLTLIPYVIRCTIQKNAITILTYHNIQYNTADLLFKTLKKKYNFISLTDYIDKLYGSNRSEIPERAIIVTMDDGYKENYQILPLIRKYQIKPTIFLCSNVVDTNNKLWFNIIKSRRAKERLKKLTDEERMKFLEDFRDEISGNDNTRIFLSRKEIVEMKDYFEFQSHTVSHPILTKCSDIKSRQEISDSKRELEEKFGFNISALAFPNGSFGDREINYMKNAHYKCGLTLNFAFNNLQSNPYILSRIPLNDDSGINEIIVKTSGLYDMIIKKIIPIRHY